MKNFNVIAAVAFNGVIGKSDTNDMPWHIPDDLKYFKEQTRGHTVIMGSKTYGSIGKPLPNRRNVVITRSFQLAADMLNKQRVDESYVDFDSAYKCEIEGFFVIGGGRVYREAFQYSPQKLFITIVDVAPAGDIIFPIAGHQFLNDEVAFNNLTYKCEKRLDWQEQNNYRFQFTQFKLV